MFLGLARRNGLFHYLTKLVSYGKQVTRLSLQFIRHSHHTQIPRKFVIYCLFVINSLYKRYKRAFYCLFLLPSLSNTAAPSYSTVFFTNVGTSRNNIMGKKIDALLGRKFKAAKFKPTISLAISRLSVLKNQRHARISVAQSDVVELLNLGHHERALIRVEQVIKEQNMLDAFVMIEGYCNLLIERVSLIEKERVCPDELEEVASSLIYASTRCGEFPELQEMRALFASQFGKEFVARAVELRNNSRVNVKMMQKLSTRQPSYESRLKVLKEIASEHDISLQNEEGFSILTEEKLNENQTRVDRPTNSGATKLKDSSLILPEDIEKAEGFSESIKGKKKYKDVADAAQAAFESAAYAAAAARAAVELSRSNSHDPDDHSPGFRSKKTFNTHESKLQNVQELDLQEYENSKTIQNGPSESGEGEMQIVDKVEGSEQKRNTAELKRAVSGASVYSADNNILKRNTFSTDEEVQTFDREVVFDGSDDEKESRQGDISISRTHDLGYNKNYSLLTTRVSSSDKSYTGKDEDTFEGSNSTAYYPSYEQSPLRSQATSEWRPGHAGSNLYSDQRSSTEHSLHLNLGNRPMSVRTKRVFGL